MHRNIRLVIGASIVVDCEFGILENVSAHKDLGLEINSNVKWTERNIYRNSQARGAHHKLKNTIPWSTPSRTKFMLYNSLVLSTLLYSC